MRQTRVLFVGGEPGERQPFESFLREWGYEVWLASDSASAMEIAQRANPDIVICGDTDILGGLKTGNSNRRIIFAAANPTINLAVTAMKNGAADFIAKPFDYPKLREVLKEAENAIATTSATIVLAPGTTAAQAERELILKTLERTGNNKAEAARMLGLDVKTIRTKLKSYQSSV